MTESLTAQALKVCPIHLPQPVALPIAEFGICRARKDGRNLYCKSCIRRKVTESRRALKEYHTARKRYAQLRLTTIITDECSSPVPRMLSPAERVKVAIRRGARTQKEIGQETRLGKDEIGDAIANLLLWTREIKTQTVGDNRLYFINDKVALPICAAALRDLHAPPRQGDVRALAGAPASMRVLRSALKRGKVA